MKTLLFTIATNGYDRLYSNCITSQREYAIRNGYDYVVVRHPRFIWNYAGRDSAWLKIPLILASFKKNYDVVLFIDADCQILNRCPPVQEIVKHSASIFVTHGFSKRINSGVIVAKNTDRSSAFFSTLLADAYTYEVPSEDDAPYENGYFINKGKNSPDIHILDSCWNNNQVPRSNDYIRHYTGPMRRLFKPAGNAWLRVMGVSLLSMLLRKVSLLKEPFDKRILSHYRRAIAANADYFADYGIEADLKKQRETITKGKASRH